MLPLKFAVAVFLVVLIGNSVVAEDPYRYFDWNVTYGTIYPLGVPQQVRFCKCNVFFFYIIYGSGFIRSICLCNGEIYVMFV